MSITAGDRRLVRIRGAERFEYCLLPEAVHAGPLHIEHVRPRKHGGGDGADNLALACMFCNLH